MTVHVFALIWVLFGAIAWCIATNRGGSSTLWVLLGKVFGPVSILPAYLVRPRTS